MYYTSINSAPIKVCIYLFSRESDFCHYRIIIIVMVIVIFDIQSIAFKVLLLFTTDDTAVIAVIIKSVYINIDVFF